jgi:hypothetical protein
MRRRHRGARAVRCRWQLVPAWKCRGVAMRRGALRHEWRRERVPKRELCGPLRSRLLVRGWRN